ncbi:MAG: class I SAM-dependent methyltransferase [Acidobacteria bacterium]|nr:class I SAM-dependent methyltransferase [Acidobacteriota bacterium]
MTAPDRDEACPICGATRADVVHRQEFLLPGDIRTQYVVVACTECGFVFARNLPSAAEYEAYYRANQKYTYEGSRDASESLLAMHRPSFALVDEHLRDLGGAHARRILDIGCSTGELLALFKAAGYRNLDGIDPTPECAAIARQLHRLTIRTAVLSEIEADEPYDVVMLANVLEHIPNLADAVRHIGSFVRDGGFLFVQVPCAEHFGLDLKEPFLEFSIEHINYCTETSLANLLAPAGFALVDARHDAWRSKGVAYPVLTSLWRKDSAAPARAREVSDTSAVRAYVARSERRLAELRTAVDELVASGEPLVIWGVGSLTARLLATTNLGRANIAGFVDSNRGHHGKQLLGKEIGAPASLQGKTMTVLVSSFVYGAEIRATLERELGYTGRIVTI